MGTSILNRSAALIGGRVAGDALQLLLYVAVVRTFTERDIGDYSFAYALAVVLGLLVGLGLRSLITREVRNSRELGASYPGNLLALHALLMGFVGAGLLAWSVMSGLANDLALLCVLAFVATSLQSVAYSLVAIVDATGAVHLGAKGEVAGKLSTVVCGFAVLLAGGPIAAVIGAQIVGALLYMTLSLYWVRQGFGPLVWRLNPALIARTARMALPFAAAALLYALYARVDILMLHRLVDAETTGQYAVAFRFVETSLIVASMVGIAVFPELATRSDDDGPRRALFTAAVKWLSLVGTVIFVGLLVAGEQLATLIFGAAYAEGGRLLGAMAVLVLIGYVKEPFWRLLIAQDREHLQLVIQAGAVALNIALNFMFIPRWSAMGAVAASVVSEALMLAGFGLVLVRQRWVTWRPVMHWLAITAAATIAGLLLRSVVWPLLAAILAVVVLAAGFLGTGFVRIDEWRGRLASGGASTP